MLQKMALLTDSILAANNAPVRPVVPLQMHACAMCVTSFGPPTQRVRRADPTGKHLASSSCFQSDSALGRFRVGKLGARLR